jgi:hypothetical protein
MFLRNDGEFDHCIVQKPVRHVIICHCSDAQQSAAMNPHKAAPTPLTNGSYASPHPLCFVLCFPRQTYLSFVLRCESSPPRPSAACRCKQSAFRDARNFLAFSMSLVYRHLCGCVGPHQLRALYFTFSVTRKILHCSAGLHVGRAPNLFVHCTQKCLKLVLCITNLSHNFRRQSNAHSIPVITFKPSGSVEINFQLKRLFDVTSL